ncbi:outer membrane beta-barrel protein [Solimonas soli]|uniref:outer membrane beta-barrel protein n=1 Tax=Solimonas soli TaxID=413479 RepID=UPI00047FD5A3|nr:outer membrane beta-barrel protein [Solimonas soli]
MDKRTWLAALALLAASGAAQAGGSVSGAIGWRQLRGAQWDRLGADGQPLAGMLADIRIGQTPLYGLVGVQVSSRELDDRPEYGFYDGSIAAVDFSAGLKLMRPQGLFRPYLAAGVTSTGVAIEYEDDYHDDHDDSDQAFGYFVAGGAQFRVARHFVAGFDLRWILGTEQVDLDGLRDDADSFVAAATFGYAWGE